ncbi:RDD family protein [Nocardioides sp. LML1-1-1.1]|uniref:RDD family protein n=1 Tax=Nocardioides sp. LML1-1-1.1 TaxID=3135248 RepID=UPI00343C6F3C
MTDYPTAPAPALVLPEGVVLASRGRRIGAYFLAIPLSIVTLGIGYFIWGAIVWGKGTSPALQVLGMRAWKQENNNVAGWGDMAKRNILDYLVVAVTCGIAAIVSFVLFLSDEERRRTLADRLGGTVIVHDPAKRLG